MNELKDMPAPSMNGKHKKQHPLNIIMGWIKGSVWTSLITLATLVGSLFAGYSFVYNTNTSNKRVPEIEKAFAEHEKRDEQKDRRIFDKLNEIALTIKDNQNDTKLINQKVDDMKERGFGTYSRETKEAIKKLK